MDQISDRLYLGDIRQAGRHQAYEQHRIDAVVQLTRNRPEQGYPPEVEAYRYAMEDGPENDPAQLERAVDRTVSLLASGNRVLVHCNVGTSRSVAVAAATTAIYHELSFERAIERIRQQRSVQVHPEVLQNAKAVVKTSQ